MNKIINYLRCRILLGTILKWLIWIISFGQGERLATWYFVKIRGKESCGCCERESRLNRLTCKEYNKNCNQIKLT